MKRLVLRKVIDELENYRLENRISQEGLAEKLGVAFCTVNRWFRGHNLPSRIQEHHIKKLINLKISERGN